MKSKLLLFITIACCIALLCICPWIGITEIHFSDLQNQELAQIFWSIRLPRVLLGFFVGALLSLCGYLFQSIFRNPLASPYTLGVSTGAALGTTLITVLSSQISPVCGGIIGAIGATLLISILALKSKTRDMSQLLIIGLMLSLFFSSIILFLQFLANVSEIFRISRWLMGSIEPVGFQSVLIIGAASLITLCTMLIYHHAISLIAIDPELAWARGVDVRKIVTILFLISSVGIGIVVTLCGPIGFIGVAIPHLVRSFHRFSQREQILLNFFLGGALLLLCDTIGRVIIAPAEVPVGVITALLASPFILSILAYKNRTSGS